MNIYKPRYNILACLCSFRSPQVTWNLFSMNRPFCFIWAVSRDKKQLKTLGIGKLGTINKISKLTEITTQRHNSVPAPKSHHRLPPAPRYPATIAKHLPNILWRIVSTPQFPGLHLIEHFYLKRVIFWKIKFSVT